MPGPAEIPVQPRDGRILTTQLYFPGESKNRSDSLFRKDLQGRFTFVNPVATRILGFDEGELLSMKYFELMRPDWVPRPVMRFSVARR